jgi:polyribonucleotide nucleotidyltransferase
MNQAISEPREEISRYAPRITTLKIPVDMIGAVIGPGGRVIREITAETGTEINIEDDGTVQVFAVEKESSDKALDRIKVIVQVPEIGTIYKAKVKKLMDFGAFVEFLPGKEGLVHISQLDAHRVAKVEDVVKVGDVIEVKLIKVDENGKMSLSRRAVLTGEDIVVEERKKSDRSRHPRHPKEHKDKTQ